MRGQEAGQLLPPELSSIHYNPTIPVVHSAIERTQPGGGLSLGVLKLNQ